MKKTKKYPIHTAIIATALCMLFSFASGAQERELFTVSPSVFFAEPPEVGETEPPPVSEITATVSETTTISETEPTVESSDTQPTPTETSTEPITTEPTLPSGSTDSSVPPSTTTVPSDGNDIETTPKTSVTTADTVPGTQPEHSTPQTTTTAGSPQPGGTDTGNVSTPPVTSAVTSTPPSQSGTVINLDFWGPLIPFIIGFVCIGVCVGIIVFIRKMYIKNLYMY